MVEAVDANFRERAVRANVEHVNFKTLCITSCYHSSLVSEVFHRGSGSLFAINARRLYLGRHWEDFVVFQRYSVYAPIEICVLENFPWLQVTEFELPRLFASSSRSLAVTVRRQDRVWRADVPRA